MVAKLNIFLGFFGTFFGQENFEMSAVYTGGLSKRETRARFEHKWGTIPEQQDKWG